MDRAPETFISMGRIPIPTARPTTSCSKRGPRRATRTTGRRSGRRPTRSSSTRSSPNARRTSPPIRSPSGRRTGKARPIRAAPRSGRGCRPAPGAGTQHGACSARVTGARTKTSKTKEQVAAILHRRLPVLLSAPGLHRQLPAAARRAADGSVARHALVSCAQARLDLDRRRQRNGRRLHHRGPVLRATSSTSSTERTGPAASPSWSSTSPARHPTRCDARGTRTQDKAHLILLVNGRFQPVIDMAPGEVQMWRIVNGSGRSGALLSGFPSGFRFRQIAQDGVQFADRNTRRSEGQPLLLRVGQPRRSPRDGLDDPRHLPGHRAARGRPVRPSYRKSGHPGDDPGEQGPAARYWANWMKFIPAMPKPPEFLNTITAAEGECAATWLRRAATR